MTTRDKLRRAFRGETEIDFIGRRRTWFLLSAAILLVCLGSLIFRGLNLGIEFKGGTQLTAPIAGDGPLADAADIEVVTELEEAARPVAGNEVQVQVASDDTGRSVIVQTGALSEEQAAELRSAVEEAVGAEIADSAEIGEQWGSEITNKALRGLIIFLFVVSAFISLRFEWKMALASLVALVHDLIITAGVYSLVGFKVTPASVIAILTILGYSLYDNVVVFDKVEEDTTRFAATGKMTYQDAANQAINEVFMRSLNTSLSTILPVGALLFIGAGLFGATTLEDLALALLVGLLVGAYSSIFVATPILAMLKEREPKYRNVRERVLRDARRAAHAPAPATASGVSEGATVSAARPAAASTSTGPARPRAGSKKAKRRKRR